MLLFLTENENQNCDFQIDKYSDLLEAETHNFFSENLVVEYNMLT